LREHPSSGFGASVLSRKFADVDRWPRRDRWRWRPPDRWRAREPDHYRGRDRWWQSRHRWHFFR